MAVAGQQAAGVGDVDLDETVHGHDAAAGSDGGRDPPSAGREGQDVQATGTSRTAHGTTLPCPGVSKVGRGAARCTATSARFEEARAGMLWPVGAESCSHLVLFSRKTTRP